MGLGLQGAYGLQSLDDLLRQRMQDRLAAEKVAEQTRQFNVGAGERAREHDLQLKMREDALAQAANQRRDTGAGALISGNTPPNTPVEPDMAGHIRSLGLGSLLQQNPEQQAAEGAGVLRTGPGAPTPQLYKPESTTLPQGGFGFQEARQKAQEALALAQANHPPKSENQPVMRVNPKSGQMEQIGSAPSGAHFVNEPTPTPQTPHFTVQPEFGPEGKPTGRQFRVNSLTGEVSVAQTPEGGAVTKAGSQNATLATRLASAKAVVQTGNDIVSALQSDPQVGPTLGRYNSLKEFIGNPPPAYEKLAGQIESYALANMGVHGMRSSQGAKQIADLLNKRLTPEAMAEAIRGLNGFANHLLENEGKGIVSDQAPSGGNESPSGLPPGVTVKRR